MDWTLSMYLVAVGGAFAGLFYPALIAYFRHEMDGVYTLGRVGRALGALGKAILLVLAGLAIGVIVVSVGFAAFLQDGSKRQELQALGTLAYFAAFSFGFTAGSVVAEPLKGSRKTTP